MKKRSGFTLIELLIVIGIIAILAGIVIIAVNPTKQFGEANDAQRSSDLNAIINAVSQYAVDGRGNVDALQLSTTPTIMQSTVAGSSGATLCDELTPDYITSMPIDPLTGSFTSCDVYNTGYALSRSAAGRITATAPDTEQQTPDITITR